MTRAQKREKIRTWQKQIRKFSLSQFENFLETLVNDNIASAENIFIEALSKEYGFGEKRISRFKDAAQKIYDEKKMISDAGDEQEEFCI